MISNKTKNLELKHLRKGNRQTARKENNMRGLLTEFNESYTNNTNIHIENSLIGRDTAHI